MAGQIDILVAHPNSQDGDDITRRLAASPQVRAAKTVSDLSAAFDFAEHHQPNLVVLAASLAQFEEFEVLRKLFDILGISCSLINDRDQMVTKETLTLGAQDLPFLSASFDVDRLLTPLTIAPSASAHPTNKPIQTPQQSEFDPRRVLLIGASTGGVDALLNVLGGFPTNCPPTLVVQHTGSKYQASLVRLLDQSCAPEIVEASNGMQLRQGCVMVAPGGESHLHIGAQGGHLICRVKQGPTVSGHRPSVDMLFKSAVPIAKHVTAAILTGMGRDGADGLLELRRAGALTYGQDEASCVVYGMPKVAFQIGAVSQQRALDEIGPALLSSCRSPSKSGKVGVV